MKRTTVKGQGRSKRDASSKAEINVTKLVLRLWNIINSGTHLSDQPTFTFYIFEKGKTRHIFKWPNNFYVLRPRIGVAGCVCKVTNWSHFLERGPRPRCLHKRTVNFRISSNCHQGFLFYSPKILPLSDFLHISRMICRCQRYNWQNIGYNFVQHPLAKMTYMHNWYLSILGDHCTI